MAKSSHRMPEPTYYIDIFEELPEIAKDFFILLAIVRSDELEFALREVGECESPIEKILSMALSLNRWRHEEEMGWPSLTGGMHSGYVIDIYPQYEVEANGHSYRVDFYIFAWHTDTSKELSLVIECDGHEFHHATKEQVQHDNEREYDLKLEGMDVLRFSGSQIYNDPFRCSGDIWEYVKAKVGPGEEEDGDLSNNSDGVLDGSERS